MVRSGLERQGVREERNGGGSLVTELPTRILRSVEAVARVVPGASYVYHKFMERLPRRFVFSLIYATNKWHGKDSISGSGSDAEQTEVIVAELPNLLAELGVRTMLDIPCGDFHWMQRVRLGTVAYTGADIVAELIEKNRREYDSESIHFQKLNLIRDPLPKVDLILCRDCLVHLSFKDAWSALRNICDSGSTYLLATTFTRRTHNDDIVTGQWRRLNLEVAPFMLPPPLETLNEGCTEGAGENDDKSLGLWRIADIRKRQNVRPREVLARDV
jgi:hypothetical protein